jgi:hypothetical protein
MLALVERFDLDLSGRLLRYDRIPLPSLSRPVTA